MTLDALLAPLITALSILAERVPIILVDPKAYPRETMTLALIAAVLMLMSVLLVLIVREYLQEKATRVRVGVRRTPRARVARLSALVLVATVAALATSLAPSVPQLDSACGTCHPIKSSVASWRKGAHADVSCLACHSRPGVLGALESSTRGGAALVGMADRVPPDSGSCLLCHARIEAGRIEARGIRVSHAEIIAGGMRCLECHHAVGHGTAAADSRSARAEARAVMAACVSCHDGVTARSGCDLCHVDGRPSDRVTDADPDGRTPAPITCRGCHSEDADAKCVNCHGLELPHPETFRMQHAGLSAKRPALCARCHESASASDYCACHVESNVHGTYSAWFPLHSKAAETNGQGGCRCHSAPFCAKCHETNPWR